VQKIMPSTLQQPMIETKEVAAVPVVPTTEATVVVMPADELKTNYEMKATSLRRAAVALLFFSVLCSRPCPSSMFAWLGVIAAFSVLCASPDKLLCRARFARFMSAFVAFFAGYRLVVLVLSINAGKPLELSETVNRHCIDMPADTFQWGLQMLEKHKHVREGISFLSRHMPNDTALLASAAVYSNASQPDVLADAEHENWLQATSCSKVAHFALCVAKMMMLGSALAHLLLLLSAAAVVKCACCLRCAAYKCGLLRCRWKCNKHACPSALVVTPASKELA